MYFAKSKLQDGGPLKLKKECQEPHQLKQYLLIDISSFKPNSVYKKTMVGGSF
jgi:hypothetical protein